MVRKDKLKAFEKLSKHLQFHKPRLKNQFICPICLRQFSVYDHPLVSDAHIIPQAIGGTLSTFTCNECNHRAGKLQDKWFTEFATIIQSPIGILAANSNKFIYGNLPLRGKVTVNEAEKTFTLRVDNKHNPPDMREKFDAQLEELYKQYDGVNKVNVGLGIEAPVLGKHEFVDAAFLTAGYLAWFKSFGYSCVFQDHLDPIRAAIINPKGHNLGQHFFGTILEAKWKVPWIGITRVVDEWALAFGFLNRVAFFPPYDRQNLYEIIKSEKRELIITRILPWNISEVNHLPAVCLFGDRILIYPDRIQIKKEYRLHPKEWPTSVDF